MRWKTLGAAGTLVVLLTLIVPVSASAYSWAARQYLRDVKPYNEAATVYRLHEWDAEERSEEDFALGQALGQSATELVTQNWPGHRDTMAAFAAATAWDEASGDLIEASTEIEEVELKDVKEERLLTTPGLLEDKQIEEDTGLEEKLKQSLRDANALRRDLGLPPAQ